MKRKKKGYVFKQERARIFKDNRGDAYREKQKYNEPTRCPGCGSLFTEGRWTWKDTTGDTYVALCPACKRIRDRYPAGLIEISGSFFQDHNDEIIHMVRNIEKAECSGHPLERIMQVEKKDGLSIISTTGMHLARHIGEALKHAYQGELDISYEAENLIRVYWHR